MISRRFKSCQSYHTDCSSVGRAIIPLMCLALMKAVKMSVTGEKLIAHVRAHAAKSPAFTYTPCPGPRAACVYVKEGKPSCLIGQALWDAGLIDASMEHECGNDYPFRDLAGYLDLDICTEEKLWLIDVQNYQDQSYPWGECVVGADMASLARICGDEAL